jgi:hypothetical protein
MMPAKLESAAFHHSLGLHTMNRCVPHAAALAAVALLAALPLPAAAQASRPFPATALRGELVLTAPPDALLNRQPARLAPGARIRDADNRVVLSGGIVGQKLLVHYTRDLQGHLLDIWVLTPAEANRKPWPTTPAEAAAWRFDPSAQAWSKP